MRPIKNEILISYLEKMTHANDVSNVDSILNNLCKFLNFLNDHVELFFETTKSIYKR